MKIVIIGPTYPFRGGISQHTSLLAKELAQNHDLKFISYKRQYPKFLFPGKSDKDPDSPPLFHGKIDYIIDSVNPISLFKAVFTTLKHKPDVLILPWWVTYWAPHYIFITRLVKLLNKTKIIYLCHNVIEHESSSLKKILTKLVLKAGDKLITQSEKETLKLVSFFPNKTIKTAFHPTYDSLHGTKQFTQAEARDKLGIEGPTLLFFGFVRPYKGLDVLLDAMPMIIKQKDINLLIVGEFWKNKEDYLQQIESLGIKKQIHMYDHYVSNEELPLYFSAADLVVQPYKSVTGSGVCQLAYGLNTPVIATKLGALKEVITDGVNGRLVPPENPLALSAAILESLKPATLSQMRTEAKKTKDKFSWKRFCEIVIEE